MKRSKIAWRFKRVKTTLLLWAIALAALHVWPFVPIAKGQGSRKDDMVFNTRGTPLSGATIRVCAMPASGQPCTPLALIYSDAALTQALANPTTTDGLGNYFFYAAPGKYEIEISGPGITTKQIPNVILPSDPTSPAFSGGISAFSLNLGGNLTVNGNTTVVGNLASGTLNLSNQVTPPGTASAGTVNLYTKAADKGLYYKNDAGVEIGPLSTAGAATITSPVTIPNPLYFDTDLGLKGPNPWADIRRYGKFGTYSSTTANTTSGSANVTLASAQSFANGEYVTVFNAGAAQTLTVPGTLTLTPSLNAGGFNTVAAAAGATSFSYKVVAADKFGGYTAASAAVSTATGNTLGMKTITITSMSRSGRVVTVTTSAAHPFVTGSEVFIQYFGGNADSSFNGWFIVSGSADTTHFTFNSGFDTASGASTSDTGGTVIGFTCNHLTWAAVTGAWKYYIYGRTSGAWTLMGQTLDVFWDDYGSPMNDNQTFPSFIPTTPPAAGANDHLTAKINSGSGTTTLTLAANAGATLTGATIVSDDGPALVAACNDTVNREPCFVGTGGARISSYTTIPVLARLIVGGTITLDDTLQFNGAETVEGWGTASSASFAWEGSGGGFFGSKAYPMISLTNGTHMFRRLTFSNTASNGGLIMTDYAGNGLGNPVVLLSIDSSVMTTSASSVDYLGQHAIFQNDGFSFRFDKMTFATGSPGANVQTSVGFSPIPSIIFKNTLGSAPAPTGSFGFTRCWFVARSSVEQDYVANSNGVNWWIVKDIQTQNSFLPPFMITGFGATGQNNNFDFEDITPADFPTAVFANLGTNGSQNLGLWAKQISCAQGGFPSITGNGFINSHFFGVCNPGQNTGYSNTGNGFFSNNSVQVNGTAGSMGYQMTVPAAPTAVVSAGGAVPVGTWIYELTALDANGNESGPGFGTTVTTTTGNQTVTITPPAAPTGSVTYKAYRHNPGAGRNAVNAGPNAWGTNMVDTFGFTAGALPAALALASGLNSANINTPALVLTGGGFKNTVSGTFTASRTTTLEDGSGFIPVTTEAFFSSPRSEQNVFLPGALTSTWTGSTWTTDKAITVTRVQVQARTAPAGCTTNAVARLTDGASPVNVTISAAANDSGAISQNYAAGASLQILLQTAASGCTTSPADANVTVQYRMQ